MCVCVCVLGVGRLGREGGVMCVCGGEEFREIGEYGGREWVRVFNECGMGIGRCWKELKEVGTTY